MKYLVLVFTVFIISCSTTNTSNINNSSVYDAYDIYKCISKGRCQKFKKGFTYNENTNFVENSGFIKAQIAKTYFSSPDIRKDYSIRHKRTFSKVLKSFKDQGVSVVDFDHEKGFIFAKFDPEITKSFFGMDWLKMNMIIFHIENDTSLTKTNLYLFVQPMKKRPLSQVFTHIDNDRESKKLKKILLNKIEELL